ncbi:PREDICTED: cytochrome P450 6g1-like [Rhagoletis zephyria]|uniref:cytochrome P450 6g1-like n=1 Tax=Rhagoletis zephyria TaxID=28612 RepID=UPI000811790C|nr:PREDICTED: cytochrome P450 6g1-like [Rhagoletis zephyria]
MLSIVIIGLLTALLTVIYVWYRYTYDYWMRHKIPFIKPFPLIGNVQVLFTLSNSFFLYLSDVYKDSRMSKAAAVGIYIINKPALVLREPELIKSVLVQEFPRFSSRVAACDPHGDTLGSNNVFFARNPQWRELRTRISPVFTSVKIKQMYELMTEIGSELESHFLKHTKTGNTYNTEIKEVCALYTTDVIASVAFGIQANSIKNPNGEFRTHGRNFMNFTLGRALSFFIAFFYPNWVSTFKVKVFTAEFSSFLRKTIDHAITEREKTGAIRNDLIDVLLGWKKEMLATQEYNKEVLDVLTAQASAFYTAGFEASSSTMAFTLYELAHRMDLQERLRNEIRDALVADHGKLSYETITNLPYLGMVVDEVLRLYPVLPAVDREHSTSEGDKPFDLRPYYDYKVPNGMAVYIPIFGIQRDPKYWPNPNTFDPERFSAENKKLHEPMAYMPFGTGPRNCVGGRVGLLQVKTGLVNILKNHFVTVCDKTPAEITFNPLSILLQCKEGIYLNVVNDGLYEQIANSGRT